MMEKMDPVETETKPDRKRISRPNDARIVRSRAALGQALLDLIDQKQFDQISIKDITEKAEFSYPVFFRQFGSKEELLADVATRQVRSLLERGRAAMAHAGGSSIKDFCAYVQEHRKVWATLLTAGATPLMRTEFSRISKEIASKGPRTNPDLPAELVTELVTSAIFDIVSWWLRQPEDYPISNVERLLDKFVIQVYRKPSDIDLV